MRWCSGYVTRRTRRQGNVVVEKVVQCATMSQAIKMARMMSMADNQAVYNVVNGNHAKTLQMAQDFKVLADLEAGAACSHPARSESPHSGDKNVNLSFR